MEIKFDFPGVTVRLSRQESNDLARAMPIGVPSLRIGSADAAGFFQIFSLRRDLWQRFDFIAYFSARVPPRRPVIFAVSHFVFLPLRRATLCRASPGASPRDLHPRYLLILFSHSSEGRNRRFRR